MIQEEHYIISQFSDLNFQMLLGFHVIDASIDNYATKITKFTTNETLFEFYFYLHKVTLYNFLRP